MALQSPKYLELRIVFAQITNQLIKDISFQLQKKLIKNYNNHKTIEFSLNNLAEFFEFSD